MWVWIKIWVKHGGNTSTPDKVYSGSGSLEEEPTTLRVTEFPHSLESYDSLTECFYGESAALKRVGQVKNRIRVPN
jgi:hypothetical protein